MYTQDILSAKKIIIGLMLGATAFYQEPTAFAADNVPNNKLPSNGQNIIGNIKFHELTDKNILNITQEDLNGVIKWKDFSIGANATVNFNRNNGQVFNTLNYVNGGNTSQIYGAINAKGGNIYLINPSGVQIGNSAQINVGSLYLANKKLDETKLSKFNGNNLDNLSASSSPTNSDLMNLGNINAAKVTFDGDKVVLDTDRIKNGTEQALDVIINSANNDVILGYSQDSTAKITVNNSQATDTYRYQWIKDSDDFKAINNNLTGKYALRNSIDMTGINNYIPIGDDTNPFKGKLEGLGYNIFGLNINSTKNTGLFGSTKDATFSHINLISGNVTGSDNVGSLIGHASNTKIQDIVNTLHVTGNTQTGGIVGLADNNTTINGAINTGTIVGNNTSANSNIGGIAGALDHSNITGETYNLGNVMGKGGNVGGIAGYATATTIGNADTNNFQIYNHMSVTGDHNVGGIVGSMNDTTVQNVRNEGNITASGTIAEKYIYHTDNAARDKADGNIDGLASEDVAVSNVGGIAGYATGTTLGSNKINNVLNKGNLATAKTDDHYDAGNIGGIVGRSENTDIDTAENHENNIYGSHNVGGIAGYLTEGKITNSTNNGGDIMATGARLADQTNFAEELIRIDGTTGDTFIVGNIGGIAGYMYGDKAFINASSNRGTVHSKEITGDKVSASSKAANAGGIVGKVDRNFSDYVKNDKLDDYLSNIKNNPQTAAISNSYNAGNVQGYSGVAGIAGFMYNGEIANSYNLGNIRTTRISSGTDAVNMGGILGDTMERSKSRVVLYNVYNKGQIGDKNIKYFGRHVGGVVGRFAGIMDTAYNAGNIYNGSSVTGGVAGYWIGGTIQNVFNTGNITSLNKNIAPTGGIFGESTALGGIIGATRGYTDYFDKTSTGHTLNLNNAYNLGTLRAFSDTKTGTGAWGVATNSVAGIIGHMLKNDIFDNNYKVSINNTYTSGNIYAGELSQTNEYTQNDLTLAAIYNKAIDANRISVKNTYYLKPTNTAFTDLTTSTDKLNSATALNFADSLSDPQNKFNQLNSTDWRFYKGTTPILNAFMPKLGTGNNLQQATGLNKSDVQFGTAYNPLLTIIQNKGDININNAQNYLNLSDGIAVFGGNLSLNSSGTASTNNKLMYSGTLYSDRALTVTHNANFGKAANLYGSSVTLNGDNDDININGNITATNGDVHISGKDINIYGKVTSAKDGSSTMINGLNPTAKDLDFTNVAINKLADDMPTVASQYAHTDTATTNGNIDITAKNDDINVLYGNMHDGKLSTNGDLSLNADSGKVYVDSDLDVHGKLTLAGKNENILDISNLSDKLVFLNNFTGDKAISFNGDNNKIAVNLWDGTKFTTDTALANALNNTQIAGSKNNADYVYTWLSDKDQLNALNAFHDSNNILSHNFALKNDIDASGLTNYQTLNTFSGTFDGRDNRILDLDGKTGLFNDLQGTVKNLKIYSSNFSGDNIGAIASTNNGTISNITTLGNSLTANEGKIAGGIVGTNNGIIKNISDRGTITGTNAIIGGVAGKNAGTIENATSNSDISGTKNTVNSLSGGIAGENTGTIDKVTSLGVTKGYTAGGIVAANKDKSHITSAYNESIVSGTTNMGGIAGTNSSDGHINNTVNATKVSGTDDNVGGLVGDNAGEVTNGRNNGAISGKQNVGGLVGINHGQMLNDLTNDDSAIIDGTQNVGGIAGHNDGKISITIQDLINRGAIYGQTNVGGITGLNDGDINGEGLTNEIELHVKDSKQQAQNFGGVAGMNTGTINGANNSGSLTAQNATNVGGIIGLNSGIIKGAIENNGSVIGHEAVGGIVGLNTGNAKFEANTIIKNAKDVNSQNSAGGIIGKNEAELTGVTMENSGDVQGKNNVGGIIGENTGDIRQSSLYNTTAGTITGTQDIGGIIGTNSGSITGGRDSNGNYYKYQIYNNGEVKGQNNIGGLIGNNKGKLTAGYNTGSASGTQNVGGIVGTNSGTVDQVFNTLAKDKTLSGDTNVGGLIGENTASGTLSNAYNSTAVNGKANVGNAVGNNAGNVNNIYGQDKLIGANSGTQKNAYTINDSNATDKHTYANFAENIWHFQNSNTSPLLKIFLTKVQIHKDTHVDWQHMLTYNGKLQGFTAVAQNNRLYNKCWGLREHSQALTFIFLQKNKA